MNIISPKFKIKISIDRILSTFNTEEKPGYIRRQPRRFFYFQENFRRIFSQILHLIFTLNKEMLIMNAEQRRKNILEASKRLFSKNGYHRTQISDIIKEVGVARGTIYQYFENKESIFITLLKDFYDKWVTLIKEGLDGTDLSDITAKDYFRNRTKMTLLFFSDDPDMCNIVLRVGRGLHGDMDSIIQKFDNKINNVISGDLQLGIRANAVRKDLDIDFTSNLLVGVFFQTAYYYFVKKKASKSAVNLDDLTEKIIDYFSPVIFS